MRNCRSASPQNILKKVYFEASPNRYLASFAPFVSENLQHPFMRKLAVAAFSNFIEANVLKYDKCREVPVGFVGSVAQAFTAVLSEVLEKYGLQMGDVLRDPMENLLHFHKVTS